MAKNNSSSAATILEIQRLSTEDGPGIRTTIFFKGCPLRCTWCQNPESISIRPQLQWTETACIGCGTCIDVCPENALTSGAEGITIDRHLCTSCEMCSRECPSAAMKMLGRAWNLEELIAEAIKDRVYFEKSGGGITLSGGDPAMQANFAALLLKSLKEEGIHTALDTSGQCAQDVLGALLPHVDMVLYDIKEIDPDRHREFTGVSNEKILDNLVYLCRYMETHETPADLWIRTPVIPGATAYEENIRGIGRFIASRLGNSVSRWELCSFNNLCSSKYERLDMDWPFKDRPLMSRECMENFAGCARGSGVDPDIVHWSGPTKMEVGNK
ncbi:MAG: glycyl-radical enzyme activating protein [Deltaproteobacteria bacterium]|nr:glycyl-radical enzyme activating protein [Deltaproteobacteria bacterium]MBW2650630.1 glycyl-radical enzyme activating protein [Deltaproteobacteria bacterium]